MFELRAPLVSWESLVTSPTTESLTIETGLMRNMMEETQDSGEGEITVETRQSGRMEDRPSGGTHNAAIENETAGENNICRAENDFCDANRGPYENGDNDVISDAESSKDSKDVQTSDSEQSLDSPEQGTDSFVSVKAQVSAAEVFCAGGHQAMSRESNLDLLSLD